MIANLKDALNQRKSQSRTLLVPPFIALSKLNRTLFEDCWLYNTGNVNGQFRDQIVMFKKNVKLTGRMYEHRKSVTYLVTSDET